MNRKSSWLSLIFLMVSISIAGRYDTRLSEILNSSSPGQWIPVTIRLSAQPDLNKLEALVSGHTRAERKQIVWNYIDNFASQSQTAIAAEIQSYSAKKLIKSVRSLRIINSIALVASPEIIAVLANRSDVDIVMYDGDPPVYDDAPPSSTPPKTLETDTLAWGVQTIRAPVVWQMGYNGAGVIVAVLDVGVQYTHPDIANQMWDGGLLFPNHGYDFVSNDNDPYDATDGHGTSCTGIVVGNGTLGNQTGVAPGARIMALRTSSSTGPSPNWAAHDFLLRHGADITTMSLGWSNQSIDVRTTWRRSFETLLIAGIHNCKSTGNSRGIAPPNSVTVPGDVPSPWRNPFEIETGGRGGVISVGALRSDTTYAAYSSNGPVTWQTVTAYGDYPFGTGHVGMIKPDISAPGDNVFTIMLGNRYTRTFSGTSAASPHIAGVLALMLSKNPELLPAEADSILQTTAMDRAARGKDNDFGAGMVRADLAVLAVPTLDVVITVRVCDRQSMNPLLHARVCVYSVPPDSNRNDFGSPLFSLFTDTMGYCKKKLPVGSYSILVTDSGYMANAFNFSVANRSHDTLRVLLERAEVKVEKNTIEPKWKLFSLYPNPFNQSTEIRFEISGEMNLGVAIFDITGRVVKVIPGCNYLAGTHSILLKGTNLSSGIYFIRLYSGNQSSIRKAVLLK